MRETLRHYVCITQRFASGGANGGDVVTLFALFGTRERERETRRETKREKCEGERERERKKRKEREREGEKCEEATAADKAKKTYHSPTILSRICEKKKLYFSYSCSFNKRGRRSGIRN